MNIYLLGLKSVQSAAATTTSFTAVSHNWVSMYVQSANLFVPVTVFLYSPFFYIGLSHSHFTLYNTSSKFLYYSILVQLAMFLLVTSLLIFNHLLLQILFVYLCCLSVQWQINIFSSPLFTGCILLSTPLTLPSIFKYLVPVLPLQYSNVYNHPFPSRISFHSHSDKISYSSWSCQMLLFSVNWWTVWRSA